MRLNSGKLYKSGTPKLDLLLSISNIDSGYCGRLPSDNRGLPRCVVGLPLCICLLILLLLDQSSVIAAEKAKKVQAFLGFASLAECQLYPVNAKYYLSLEGVPMGYNCRSKDASAFTLSRRMEIDQMRELTEQFKADMGIE